MTVAPMKYAERTALGQHLIDEDHDLLVDGYRGFTPAGIFVSPYSFLVSTVTDGGTPYYGASNAYQTIYGGFSTANHHIGGVDGANYDALIAKLLSDLATTGGVIAHKNAVYPLTAKVESAKVAATDKHISIIGEGFDTIWKWTGAAAGTMFGNLTKRHLNGFTLANMTLDVDSIANVKPVHIDSVWRYNFNNLLIKNCVEKPAFTINASTAPAGGGISNTAFCSFNNIYLQDVYGAFEYEGSQSGSEITLCKMQNIWADNVSTKGIAFKGWASGIYGNTVWLDLTTIGAVGVVWNDSITPTLNVGDYDNSFDNLKIDSFGAAEDPTTVLLKFNNTKMDVVRGFFHSPSTTTSTTIAAIAETVSYYVEDVTSGPSEPAATNDLYIRIYQKGYMHGSATFDSIALYANAAPAYLSVNDLYAAQNAEVHLRTNVNKEALIWLAAADNVFRITVPDNTILKLPDAAGAKTFMIHDSGDAAVFTVNSNGEVLTGGVIQAVGGYKSSDGSAGGTQAVVISGTTMNFKNGLLTSVT
jgi:hypothetical protein